MDHQIVCSRDHGGAHSLTLRDVLGIGFRHQRLIVLAFVGTFLGVVFTALVLPRQYQAHMKILVKRTRVDPVVTPESNPMPQLSHELVTEEELNSEVELIKSRDLLEKVVVLCSLHLQNIIPWFPWFSDHAAEEDRRIAEAVRKLEGDLKVELLKKTNLIEVTYPSPDAKLSARVLTTLADLYLGKHLAVHRPPGAFDFFHQETERYRQGVAASEARLSDFSREQGVVSAQLEKDSTLQKANEFDASLQQTRAAIAETEQRIRALEGLAASTPSRRITQIRTSDNAQLLEQLKSTLLTFELKRTALLDKYDPSYPPVGEAETQVAQTRAAIAAEQNSPVRDETTDRDPTYEWLNAELAKARTDLSSLRARAAATANIVRDYREKARRLDINGMVEQDLIRDVRAAEENYQLYLRKREEARISDALDSRRIVNVAIAEVATPPALPSWPRWPVTLLLGGLLATAVSAGSALVSDYMDPSLRTSDEVEAFLDVPVLAAIPNNPSELLSK